MPRSYKKKDIVSESLNRKKVCPNCGHDDFSVVESNLSWLTGQQSVCAKCGYKFKNAALVKVHHKEKHITENTHHQKHG